MLKKLLHSTKSLQILSGCLFVLCIILFASFFENKNQPTNKIIHDNRGYFFTNPILDCEMTNSGEELSISRKSAHEEVEKIKEKHDISFMSVYFRDLNNGPWLGVNEKEEFIPASLLKVPLTIALFRYAEENEQILSQEVFVSEKHIQETYPQSVYSAPVQMTEGEKYNFREIARRTLVYSDNLGVTLISESLPQKYIEDLYLTIGGSGLNSNVRVKDYASFFRVLYNASYLDRKYSEELLKILSETEYREGIVAGVPENVKVSHKFGEFTKNEALGGALSLSETEVQLHDCGIVYYPNKPYILCVMTRGDSYTDQEKAIADISRFFFEEVKSY